MSISRIQPNQVILNTNRPPKDSSRQVQRELASGQSTDKVSLSGSSKFASGTAQSTASSLFGAPDGQCPVEYYAMPTWMASMSPVELTGKIGAKANELYAKGGDLVGTHDREMLEYGKLLDKHYQGLMAKEGIDNPQKHYEALIADKDNSERLHQLMIASINGDSRMKDLMAMLKINMALA